MGSGDEHLILGGAQTDFARNFTRRVSTRPTYSRRLSRRPSRPRGFSERHRRHPPGNAFGQIFTGQGHLGGMPATVEPGLWGACRPSRGRVRIGRHRTAGRDGRPGRPVDTTAPSFWAGTGEDRQRRSGRAQHAGGSVGAMRRRMRPTSGPGRSTRSPPNTTCGTAWTPLICAPSARRTSPTRGATTTRRLAPGTCRPRLSATTTPQIQ